MLLSDRMDEEVSSSQNVVTVVGGSVVVKLIVMLVSVAAAGMLPSELSEGQFRVSYLAMKVMKSDLFVKTLIQVFVP